MRKWMRDRLRRRKRKPAPDAESTGKIGQEKPAGITPLVPSYALDDVPAAPPPPPAPKHEPRPPRHEPRPPRHESRPPRQEPRPPRQEPRAQRHAPADAGRMVVETQPESLTAPPAAEAIPQPPKPQAKAPRGIVVLAIGLPGSGKTTWFKRRGITPLSSDMLRTILFDNITEQRYQHLVFSTLRSLLRARLIAKMPWNYVDATNLSPHERKQWIKMAKSFGYEVQAVFFDVPVEVCLDRNRRRERMVPEDVMQRMAAKLKPPTFAEGFSKIVVVRVKQSRGEEQS